MTIGIKRTLGQMGLAFCLLIPSPFTAVAHPTYSDIRVIKLGTPKPLQTINLDVKPNEISLLFNGRSTSPDDEITILEITDPQNEVIYGYDPKTDEIQGADFDQFLHGFGELTLFMPSSSKQKLRPGTYQIKLTTKSGRALQEAGAILKSGSHKGTLAFDLTFWILSHHPTLQSPLKQQKMVNRIQKQIESITRPYGLKLGQVNIKVGSPAMTDKYASVSLNEDEELRSDICQQLANQTEQFRQLNIAILDEIKPTQASNGKDENEFEFYGFSPGLPGMMPAPNARWSCVLLAYTKENANERGAILWHEISHWMGLFHTTEEDGTSFDPLTDTPECPVEAFDQDGDGFVDDAECAAQDGHNYMFWVGQGKEMSQQQSWVLRHHPLFYHVE